MNRIMKAANALVGKVPFTSRISGVAITLFWAVALLCGAPTASAACGQMEMGSRSPIRFPLFAPPGGDQQGAVGGFNNSIVGLWHVIYTADGATFNESLDQWHSDGTEFENAWLPPDAGNICFGVWKEIGPGTVRLHHVGWTFTPGSTPPTASGTFTIDETNTVSRDGKSYTGTFTFRMFDGNGVETGSAVTGTLAATRITVD